MRGAHAPPRVFSRALRPDDGAASRPPSSVRAGCIAPVRKKTNNDLYGQTCRGCVGAGIPPYVYDEKKRELLKKKGAFFLCGQTDMLCLSVTKWTLDVLSIEKRKKKLIPPVDM